MRYKCAKSRSYSELLGVTEPTSEFIARATVHEFRRAALKASSHDERTRTGPAGKRQAKRHSEFHRAVLQGSNTMTKEPGNSKRQTGSQTHCHHATTSENRTPQNNARTITGKPEGVFALLSRFLSCVFISVSQRLFVQTMDVVYVLVSKTLCSMRSEAML